jgi:hypothetical protein
MNEIQELALKFLTSGIAVIPIRYKDKKPEVKEWGVFQNSLPKTEQVKTWFAGRLHNLGIITGYNGLTVIDFDTLEEYNKWYLWANLKGGITSWVAKNAFRVQTSRGVHVYIRLPENERSRKTTKAVDIKGFGGYVLGPGSIHPTGAIYTQLNDVWSFPLVKVLSDVLPVDLLLDVDPVPWVVAPKTVSDDPWVIADSINNIGKGAVDKVRSTFKLLDFFPGAVRSGGNNRWYVDWCPFHPDSLHGNSRSFWIDNQRGICNCYSCNFDRPMDVINFYARLHGLSNLEALQVLTKMC